MYRSKKGMQLRHAIHIELLQLLQPLTPTGGNVVLFGDAECDNGFHLM